MRIIAGQLGGRNFSAPSGHRTHPMSEKACGALFNALGDINGLTVLDAFAGSGALGFEAVSRGALSVCEIEIDKIAQRTILDNIKSLGISSKVKLICASVGAWMRTNPNAVFDIVICDPPYDNLQQLLLGGLVNHLKPNGVYILSWPGKELAPQFGSLKIVNQRSYGDIQLVFYRKD